MSFDTSLTRDDFLKAKLKKSELLTIIDRFKLVDRTANLTKDQLINAIITSPRITPQIELEILIILQGGIDELDESSGLSLEELQRLKDLLNKEEDQISKEEEEEREKEKKRKKKKKKRKKGFKGFTRKVKKTSKKAGNIFHKGGKITGIIGSIAKPLGMIITTITSITGPPLLASLGTVITKGGLALTTLAKAENSLGDAFEGKAEVGTLNDGDIEETFDKLGVIDKRSRKGIELRERLAGSFKDTPEARVEREIEFQENEQSKILNQEKVERFQEIQKLKQLTENEKLKKNNEREIFNNQSNNLLIDSLINDIETGKIKRTNIKDIRVVGIQQKLLQTQFDLQNSDININNGLNAAERNVIGRISGNNDTGDLITLQSELSKIRRAMKIYKDSVIQLKNIQQDISDKNVDLRAKNISFSTSERLSAKDPRLSAIDREGRFREKFNFPQSGVSSFPSTFLGPQRRALGRFRDRLGRDNNKEPLTEEDKIRANQEFISFDEIQDERKFKELQDETSNLAPRLLNTQEELENQRDIGKKTTERRIINDAKKILRGNPDTSSGNIMRIIEKIPSNQTIDEFSKSKSRNSNGYREIYNKFVLIAKTELGIPIPSIISEQDKEEREEKREFDDDNDLDLQDITTKFNQPTTQKLEDFLDDKKRLESINEIKPLRQSKLTDFDLIINKRKQREDFDRTRFDPTRPKRQSILEEFNDEDDILQSQIGREEEAGQEEAGQEEAGQEETVGEVAVKRIDRRDIDTKFDSRIDIFLEIGRLVPRNLRTEAFNKAYDVWKSPTGMKRSSLNSNHLKASKGMDVKGLDKMLFNYLTDLRQELAGILQTNFELQTSAELNKEKLLAEGKK